MRTIQISTETFAIIWSRRLDGEESEDVVLKRLLRQHLSDAGNELGTVLPDMSKAITRQRRTLKITWAYDISEVLSEFGGHASLQEIYRAVTELRKAAGRSVPPSFEATVRRTLEDHCKASENFRGEDLFEMVEGKGAGIWGLRKK